MANEVVIHVKGDTAQAEGAVTSLAEKMKTSAQQLRGVGIAMTAFGGAITAALGMATKAALDEQINIAHLSQTLKNVGADYDAVKDSLEAVIAATQRKTGIADNEQRDILSRLLLVTNDYQTALNLLPTVLDLAAAGQMDATTAATYLGKAFLELEEGAEEVTVRFGQASLQFKSMEEIQGRVSGSAEAMANPLAIVKAEMGDLAEAIGTNLLPVLRSIVDTIIPILSGIKDWTQAHPALTRAIVLITATVGVLTAALGALILILPTVIAGLGSLGVAFAVATGPIGLTIAALAALGIGGAIAFAKLTEGKKATDSLGAGLDVLHPKIEVVAQKMTRMSKATQEAIQAAQEIVAAAQFAETGAGVLGITVDQIAQAFLRLGGDSKVLVAALAATASETDKVNALLDKLGISSIEVANALGRASQAQTEWIENEREAVKAAEDYIKTQAQLAQSLDSIVTASQFALTTAGELGLTVDKVGVAFLKLGGDSTVLRAALQDTAGASDKVSALLTALGLTTMEAANAVGVFTQAQQEAMRFMEDYERQQRALIESTEGIVASALYATTAAGDLGLSVDSVAEAFLRLGGNASTLQNALIDTAGATDKVNALLSVLGLSAEQAAAAVGILTEAQKTAALEADNLRRENERLENQWKTLQERAVSYLAQIGYNLSAAGKLRISTQDVGAAFLGLGGNVDRLRAAFIAAQGQGDEVNAMLKALGLTAQQVAEVIDRLNQKTSDLLKPEGPSPLQAARLQALQAWQTIPQTPENIATLQALSEAFQGNWTLEQQSAHERRLRGLPSLATGGIITQPTLALLGERGPEAVVPLTQTPLSISVTITNHGIIGVTELDAHIVQTIRDAKRRGAFEGVIA